MEILFSDIRNFTKISDSASAKELAEKGYTLPEYHFVAEYDGAESEGSKVLAVSDWICKQFVFENSNDVLPETKYTLRLPDGSTQKGTTDKDGHMEKKHSIPFGLLEITIGED